MTAFLCQWSMELSRKSKTVGLLLMASSEEEKESYSVRLFVRLRIKARRVRLMSSLICSFWKLQLSKSEQTPPKTLVTALTSSCSIKARSKFAGKGFLRFRRFAFTLESWCLTHLLPENFVVRVRIAFRS